MLYWSLCCNGGQKGEREKRRRTEGRHLRLFISCWLRPNSLLAAAAGHGILPPAVWTALCGGACWKDWRLGRLLNFGHIRDFGYAFTFGFHLNFGYAAALGYPLVSGSAATFLGVL